MGGEGDPLYSCEDQLSKLFWDHFRIKRVGLWQSPGPQVLLHWLPPSVFVDTVIVVWGILWKLGCPLGTLSLQFLQCKLSRRKDLLKYCCSADQQQAGGIVSSRQRQPCLSSSQVTSCYILWVYSSPTWCFSVSSNMVLHPLKIDYLVMLLSVKLYCNIMIWQYLIVLTFFQNPIPHSAWTCELLSLWWLLSGCGYHCGGCQSVLSAIS